MRSTPLILIVDDNAANLDILRTRLANHGYEILAATDGEEALRIAREERPDLVLLDVMMPKMDGTEVCRRLKGDPSFPFIPIIMVTAKSDARDIIAGLEAGADEYLTKPVDQPALVARVKSMLRIKALHDMSQEQAARLEAQAQQLAEWNQRLEERVAAQLAELRRVAHLKQFFSPQLVEYIVSGGGDNVMESHRREITGVFCDLRGFTAFAETAEPEEVMRVLREYHDAVGPLTFEFEATLEHIAGDGLTAFFNDPRPCPDPAARAVRMALAQRQAVDALIGIWRKRGYELGFGVGIALGYATLGQIGFSGRFHYGAIGSVLNLASRLCDKARSGQILISQRVYAEVEDLVEVEPLGELMLRGFSKPVTAFNVVRLKAEQPEAVE
ncbi:response regulator [Rhodospirillaceae bacterium SYSU D60014]|uniref:adenylate/guanylate cyclase domain-containing protein n=1 Tax=Virgifigura deserti TaxID=2268457 RepID=UPI000E66FE84